MDTDTESKKITDSRELRGAQQFGPAVVKAARGCLAVYVIRLAREARIVGALMAEPHLDIEHVAPRHVAAQHALDFEPVLAVVLLEHPADAERTHHAEPDRVLLLGRHPLVDQRPCPHLDFGWSARMPYAHRIRPRQKRESREDIHMPAEDALATHLAEPANRLLALRTAHILDGSPQHFSERALVRDGEEAGAVSLPGGKLPSLLREPGLRDVHPFREQGGYRRGVADFSVIHIARELLVGELPVAIEHPFVESADDFGAFIGAVEVGVEIPLHVAKVVGEGKRFGVPVAEDESLVVLEARDSERTPLALVEFVVEAVLLVRHRDEITRDVVGPSVIRAHENFRVAHVGAAKAHPAMAALIHEGRDRAVALSHDEDRILGHVGRKKVTRLRNLALVAEEEPRAGENSVEFELVDRGIDENRGRELAGLDVDQASHVEPIAGSPFRAGVFLRLDLAVRLHCESTSLENIPSPSP